MIELHIVAPVSKSGDQTRSLRLQRRSKASLGLYTGQRQRRGSLCLTHRLGDIWSAVSQGGLRSARGIEESTYPAMVATGNTVMQPLTRDCQIQRWKNTRSMPRQPG